MSRRNNKNSSSRGGNRTPNPNSYSNASGTKAKRAPNSASFKGIYQNQSVCQVLTALVGSKCEVSVRNANVKHEGFFNTFSSDMDFAVSAVHKVKMAGDGPQKGDIVDDMIFPINEVVSMSFEAVDLNYATEDTFTDGAIALKKKDQLSADKELVSWMPDPDVEDVGDLDCVIGNPGGPPTGNGWSAEDMFNVNKSKFDVQTSYDKDLSGYTVELKRTEVSNEQVRRANQLAKQIEDSANYQQNIKWELEDTRDEETKFSAVDESANAEGDPNRYIPPSLRSKGPPPGHSRQNSGSQKPGTPTGQRQSQGDRKTTPRKEQLQTQNSQEQRSRKSSEKEARKSASKEDSLPQRKPNMPGGGSSLGAPPGITAPPQPNRNRNWAGVAGGTGGNASISKMSPSGAKPGAKLEDLKTFSNNFNLKQPEGAAQPKASPQGQSTVQQKGSDSRKNSRATPSPMTKAPAQQAPAQTTPQKTEAAKSESGTPAASKPLNPNAKEWTPNVNATEFKPTFGAKKPATPNPSVPGQSPMMPPMMPQSPPVTMDPNMARPSPGQHVPPHQMPQIYPFQYNQPIVQVPPHGVPHIMMQPTGAPIYQPGMAGQPPHIPVSGAQVRGQTPQPGTPQPQQGQTQPPSSKPGGRQRPVRPGHQHPTSPPNMAHAGQYVVQPGYPAPHPQHIPQMYQDQAMAGSGYIQVNRSDQYPQYYQQPMHPAVTSASNQPQGGSVVYHHGNPHQPTPHINHTMPHMTHPQQVIQYNHMSPGNQPNQAMSMQHPQMYRQMPPNAQPVQYQPQQGVPPQGTQSQPHQ